MNDAQMTEAQAPVEATSIEAASEVKTETTETVETPEPEKKDRVELPKEVARKLSKQDRRIGALTAERYALKQELEALRSKAAPTDKPQADGKPREEDFEGKPYGEYLDALTDWKVEQKLKQAQVKDSEKKAQQDSQTWEQERAEALDDNAEQAKEAFSDFQAVVDKAIPREGLAPHVKKAFLEARNGAFALYALAKEGVLEDLNELSPMQAAMEIGRMEDKGIALSKKQTTKAPAPLSPAKGTGTGTKDPSQMTDEEFNAWRRASIAKNRR